MDTEQRAEIIQQRTRDTMKLDPKVDLQLGGLHSGPPLQQPGYQGYP
jgi:hypothetical protein